MLALKYMSTFQLKQSLRTTNNYGKKNKNNDNPFLGYSINNNWEVM